MPWTNDLDDEIRAVLDHCVGTSDPVALVDYPQHFNAGDTLIYRGERSYLDALTGGVGYVCTRHDYDRSVLDHSVPLGPIVLHGGGNFGDRYAAFQLLREQVIDDHPDRPIVQMPQTMEFRDTSSLARAQEVYGRHPDLTLLLRSSQGYADAQRLFPHNRVRFCPDVAFGAGRLHPSSSPDHDYVVLKRRDGESVVDRKRLPGSLVADAYVCDWHAGVVDNLRWWPGTWATRLVHRVRPLRERIAHTMSSLYDWQAEIILRSAVDIISRGRVVVTDRLHAAVFGVLLDKPVVMVDNANHKLSEAYRDYLHTAPDVHLAADFDRAAELAAALLP